MYKKNNDKNLNWENCEILHEVALNFQLIFIKLREKRQTQ